MKIVLILAFLTISQISHSLELKYLSHVTIPSKQKFEKTTIGGLSGIYFDSNDSSLFAVCDDRGNVNEPRIYQFSLKLTGDKMDVQASKVIFLKTGDPVLSHSKKTFSTDQFSKVIDMEGLAKLPWGDFLVTNEGDLNKKPRVMPQIFSVNSEGIIQKQYEIPAKFMPELEGQQKTGIRNNLAFEGLAGSPDGKHWLVATEASLQQDTLEQIRWLEYQMPEAWTIKPAREFIYPMPKDPGSETDLFQFQKGISEVAYLDSKRVLAMERYLRVNSTGIDFSIQIFLTDLENGKKAAEPVLLKKQLVLDLAKLKDQIGSISNFEGMTLGPVLPGNRKTLILVSDDNFKKEMKTQFVLLEIKEDNHGTTNDLEIKTRR